MKSLVQNHDQIKDIEPPGKMYGTILGYVLYSTLQYVQNYETQQVTEIARTAEDADAKPCGIRRQHIDGVRRRRCADDCVAHGVQGCTHPKRHCVACSNAGPLNGFIASTSCPFDSQRFLPDAILHESTTHVVHVRTNEVSSRSL